MDKTVLLDQSQAFDMAYQEAGRFVELYVLAGSNHGGKEFYTGRNGKHLVAFLQKQSGASAEVRASWKYSDPRPQRYSLSARASVIDSRTCLLYTSAAADE